MNAAESHVESTPPDSLFDPRVRAATAAVLTTVALSAFEGLAVAAALPEVGASLGNVAWLPYVITAYLITGGVATAASGPLVDRYGVRPIYRASVVVFTLGGVLAGLAPTMQVLVAARALQGAGGGAVIAVGLAAVNLSFPRQLVGRAFAANSTVWGVMGVAGPAIAAGMLLVASWRWVFLINLPLGLTALYMGWSAFPGRREDAGDKRLPNPLDLGLLALVLSALIWAADALDASSVLALAIAAVAGAIVLQRGRTRPDAPISTRHAVDAPVGPIGWIMALLLIGGIGTQSFVPLYVRGALGGGTLLTSASILFFVVGWTSGANVSSKIMPRWGPLAIIVWGARMVPFALAGLTAAVWWQLPIAVTMATLFAAGFGIGCATNAGLTLLRDVVEDDEVGSAVATHQFMRNLGFAIGNALVGGVILAVVGALTGDVEQIRGLLSAEGPISDAPHVSDALGTGYAAAAAVGTVVAALAVLPVLRLQRSLR